ncbi:hypothetical protein DW322_10375 [Rhodococcus rhodnii]|uniref:Uncharacterized protein n=1 Tax=Rhodococcus rhodnii TaxID=38312 RepID=A0A6P2CDC6_9NOCA|nr:hypothetical protein [Rhodococcus rhodnii]TXG90555.1 hypothetical protein DW322_10375 [Rhodococcus rhodnii]
MEPIEISAGQFYLRAPRADDRIDDRTSLADLGISDPDHVEHSLGEWHAGTRYSWVVCETTSGEPLAHVTLDPDGAIAGLAHPDGEEALDTGFRVVTAFAEAGNLPHGAPSPGAHDEIEPW